MCVYVCIDGFKDVRIVIGLCILKRLPHEFVHPCTPFG